MGLPCLPNEELDNGLTNSTQLEDGIQNLFDHRTICLHLQCHFGIRCKTHGDRHGEIHGHLA